MSGTDNGGGRDLVLFCETMDGRKQMVTQTEKKGATTVKFKPLKDRVFVSYTEEADRTAGGIYIPDAAKEKSQKGKIEAVGGDVKTLKVGDEVLFDKYAGTKITFDGTDYLIVKEEDILGVFEK
jgi:chaperonin GroES